MHQNKFEHLTLCQNKLEHLIEFNNAARIKQVTLKFFLYSYIHILVIIIHDEIQNLMNKFGGRTVVGQRRRALSHLYCIFVFLFSRILVFANSCFCKFLFLRIFCFLVFADFWRNEKVWGIQNFVLRKIQTFLMNKSVGRTAVGQRRRSPHGDKSKWVSQLKMNNIHLP